MSRTKKTNWEKIVLLLKGKGASDLEIDVALKDAVKNKEKEKALIPLQEKYHVSLKDEAEKYPTLQEYFGKFIADLLIKRREILNRKKINIHKFAKKSLEELTVEEQKQYMMYLQNQESLKELEEIDNKLIEKGLIITDKKREDTTLLEKQIRTRINKAPKEKKEESSKDPEDNTIQF